jgi:ABC-type spermidine/putrescine transport system permease subunit II
MRRRWQSLGILYLGGIYLFLFLPVVLVLLFSFNESRFWAFPLRGFSWRWYAALITRPDALDALWSSVIVAVPTMVISVLLGTGFAIAFHRRRFRFKVPRRLEWVVTTSCG